MLKNVILVLKCLTVHLEERWEFMFTKAVKSHTCDTVDCSIFQPVKFNRVFTRKLD